MYWSASATPSPKKMFRQGINDNCYQLSIRHFLLFIRVTSHLLIKISYSIHFTRQGLGCNNHVDSRQSLVHSLLSQHLKLSCENFTLHPKRELHFRHPSLF